MKRRQARELAVQALYHIAMNRVTPAESVRTILEEALAEDDASNTGEKIGEAQPFVLSLVEGTSSRLEHIDKLLKDYLKGWKVDRLSKVDLQILRLAAYEMIYDHEVPPKVAINEAIELAKHYGTEQSGKFVNGVLGKLILDLDELKKKIPLQQ